MPHRLKLILGAMALALAGLGTAQAGPIQWDAKHDSDTLSVIDVVDADAGFETIEQWVLAMIGRAELRSPEAWRSAIADERRAREDRRPGRDKPNQVNQVPEPSALALAGIGLVGLAFIRRRRSTSSS